LPAMIDRFLTRRGILVGTLVLLLAYASTVTPTFVMMDDWVALDETSAGRSGSAAWALALGRPLNALFIHGGFRIFDSIDAAKFIRMVGLVGTVFCYALLTLWLKVIGFRRNYALLTAFGTCLLPPFCVVAMFASIASYTWSVALGLVAVHVLQRALCAISSGWQRQPDLARLGASFGLILATLLSYPPAALVVLLVPLPSLVMFNTNHRIDGTLRILVATGIVFAAAAVSYLLLWTLYRSWLFPEVDLGNRTLVTSFTQLFGNLSWFWHQVLFEASTLFVYSPKHWLAGCVLAMCLGQFVLLPACWSERCLRALLWLLLLPAVYSINLVVHEQWASYRSLCALQMFIWLSLVFAIWRIFTTCKPRLPAWPSTALSAQAVAVALCAGLALRQAFLIGPELTQPNVRELGVARAAIAALDPSVGHLTVVQAHWSDNAPAFVRYDEIGAPSSSSAFAVAPMVRAVYFDVNRKRFAGTLQVVPARRTVQPTAQTLDFGHLLRGASAP
jgi:hypothetical protein